MSSEIPRQANAGHGSPRHEHLALQWRSEDGESRILARGRRALSLYRNDLGDGFPDGGSGTMTLGTIGEDGSFSPLIRRSSDTGAGTEPTKDKVDPVAVDGSCETQDH